jgi:hypothetical protein
MSEKTITAPMSPATNSRAPAPWPAMPAGSGAGWACCSTVLQHRGVVAWLRAWHAVAVTPTDTPARGTTATLPRPGVADRLVDALAAMALGALAGR